MWFYYDHSGTRAAFEYQGDMYYYVYNVQGDVTYIVDGSGTACGGYRYDSWGKIIDMYGSVSTVNPFRYRGYYYDSETELYYLNSRYYNPDWGRFVNADGQLSVGSDLSGLNLFAYCGNNPVVRVDHGGEFWDIIFDAISFIVSVVDVVKNPSDPMAWVGLAVDAVCLVTPILTGGGAIVKAGAKADDVVDVVKNVNKVDNVVDTAKTAKTAKAAKTAKTAKGATKVHGNSLRSTKTNYGYALLDKDKNIMKFGETLNPRTRYSQKYLKQNEYSINILESGSKADIHYWQYDMNMYYKSRYGSFPPLNRRGW